MSSLKFEQDPAVGWSSLILYMFLSFGFQESKTPAECAEFEKYARTLIILYIFFEGFNYFAIFGIFRRRLDSNPRICHSKQGRYHLPIIDNFARDIFGHKLRTTPFLSERGNSLKTKLCCTRQI